LIWCFGIRVLEGITGIALPMPQESLVVKIVLLVVAFFLFCAMVVSFVITRKGEAMTFAIRCLSINLLSGPDK